MAESVSVRGRHLRPPFYINGGYAKNRNFSKPINSKTNEPILINFFLKETRIFSLQVCEDILLKFYLEIFLQRFKISLKISLCYENFPQIEFRQKLFTDL